MTTFSAREAMTTAEQTEAILYLQCILWTAKIRVHSWYKSSCVKSFRMTSFAPREAMTTAEQKEAIQIHLHSRFTF